MSPLGAADQGKPDGFPRVSGDEPSAEPDHILPVRFSPREWG